MAVLEKSRLFQSPKLDSRIKSANVQPSEQWLGYFTSPMLLYMAYYSMSGSYLNQFYVDVLKIGGIAGGLFLVLLPVLSKVFDAVTNLLMGMIIDRTRTRQGKVRPWILIAGPLVTLTGFTATMNSVMLTIMAGVGTKVFNAGLRIGKVGGYIEPLKGTSITNLFAEISEKGLTAQLAQDAYTANADGVFTVGLVQSAAVNRWLVICVALIPAITYIISAVFGYFNDVGEKIPQISKDIQERHRAAAEARGEVYVSPEEKAALEQAENDRIAEENRIAELKAKCEKKGLSFDEEEAKYQARLAEQKAKAEAKAAKKNKKK